MRDRHLAGGEPLHASPRSPLVSTGRGLQTQRVGAPRPCFERSLALVLRSRSRSIVAFHRSVERLTTGARRVRRQVPRGAARDRAARVGALPVCDRRQPLGEPARVRAGYGRASGSSHWLTALARVRATSRDRMADDSDSYVPGPLDHSPRSAQQGRALCPRCPCTRASCTRAPGRRAQHRAAPRSRPPVACARFTRRSSRRRSGAAGRAEPARPSELAEDDSRLARARAVLVSRRTPFDARAGALAVRAEAGAARRPRRACARSRCCAARLQFVDGRGRRRAGRPLPRTARALPAPARRAPRTQLREHAPKGPWGEQARARSRAPCADRLAALGYAGVEPTRAGIERLEAVVVAPTRRRRPLDRSAAVPGAVRLGRGRCAVIRSGAPVQWGVCEPDPETQLAPPPVLRVDARRRELPCAARRARAALVRHAQRARRGIPTLGAWAEHEFT